MARIHIPDTHGFISGRGSKNAGLALEAAIAAGESTKVVRATQGGYIVPLNVLEFYEKAMRAQKRPASAKAPQQAEKPAAEKVEVQAEQVEQAEAQPEQVEDEKPAAKSKSTKSKEPAPASSGSK